jgi:hypothetical protein
MQTFFQGTDGTAEPQVDAASGIVSGRSSDVPREDPRPEPSAPATAPATDHAADLARRLETLEAERAADRQALQHERERYENLASQQLYAQQQRDAEQRQGWAYQQQSAAAEQYLSPPQIDYEAALTDPKVLADAFAKAVDYGDRRAAYRHSQLEQQVQGAQRVVPHVTRSAKEWARHQAREFSKEQGVPAEDFDAAWGGTMQLLPDEVMRMSPEVVFQANSMARTSMGRHLPSKNKSKAEPSVPVSGRSAPAAQARDGKYETAFAAAAKRLGLSDLSPESKAKVRERMAAGGAR